MKYIQEIDEPLDEETESIMDRVGSKVFLQECINRLGVKIDKPVELLTDLDARKVVRGIYRNASDYRGTIQ